MNESNRPQQDDLAGPARGLSNAQQALIVIAATAIVAASLLCPTLILIAPSDEQRFTNALLGAVCFVFASLLALLAFATWRRRNASSKKQVPQAHAAVITKERRRLRIVRGPGEVLPHSRDGEEVSLEDLRDQRLTIHGEYITSDNARPKLRWEAIWQIADLVVYLDSAAEPKMILEGVLQSRMLYYIARYARKDLAGKLKEIADAVVAESNRHTGRYGIYVVAANFTQVDIPGEPPKSPKPGEAEAERVRNLDGAVREANPRTMLHIERLARINRDQGDSSKQGG